MELPQRHREHGVRIRKEEINHRNSGIRNIFKSELSALCVSVVITFPSASSLLCDLLTVEGLNVLQLPGSSVSSRSDDHLD